MSFFIVATSILILSYIYIGWRIIVPLQLGPGVKKMLWALLILSIPAVPVYLVLRSNEIILPFTDTLSWIAYLSLGYFCLVFTFVFARDMVLVFIRVFKRSIQFLHGAFKSSSHSDCPSADMVSAIRGSAPESSEFPSASMAYLMIFQDFALFR